MSKEQINRASHIILEKLESKNLLKVKSTRDRILAVIESVITADFKAEDDLDLEAEKVLKQYTQSGANIDKAKMLAMIKKELIKKKKLVL